MTQIKLPGNVSYCNHTTRPRVLGCTGLWAGPPHLRQSLAKARAPASGQGARDPLAPPESPPSRSGGPHRSRSTLYSARAQTHGFPAQPSETPPEDGRPGPRSGAAFRPPTTSSRRTLTISDRSGSSASPAQPSPGASPGAFPRLRRALCQNRQLQ